MTFETMLLTKGCVEWKKKQEVRKKLPCILYFYYTFLKNATVGKL